MRNKHIHNAAVAARLRAWVFAALALLLVSGCSLPSFFGPSEPPPNADAAMLYKEGLDFLARKKYVNAIDRFQRVKADYPFAQEVLMAELKLSEAYYLNEQYPETIEALKDFIAAHPSSEHVPYALYTAGMAHFDQYTASDREQKLTEIAKGYFERVAKDFPKSPFAPQAREKLAKCLEYLAEHEFIVASFYINEKKYPAAQDRLEDLLRKYKDTAVAPKALYQLAESYRLEKNNVKAGLAYEALLHYYPGHPLAKTAQAQLSQLAKEKQDPLAALLKRERRPGAPALTASAPAQAGAAPAAGASKPKELNLVAKTEVVNEDPSSQRSFLSRLNPFSSSPPPPDKAEAKKKEEEAKAQPAAKKAEAEKSEGFFASLWRGINPFSSKAGAKPSATAAKDPQLVGDIDQSLKARGAAQGAKPSAPKTDLPQAAEPAAPPPDAQAILGSVDATLGKKGVSARDLPPPPETSSALKTTDAERTAERSRTAATPAPDSGFVSKLDEALKQRGIDPAKIEQSPQKPPATGARPLVARPKPEPQIQLEPRLGLEKKGPLLGAQEFQPQERPAPLKEADLAPGMIGSAPEAGAEAASPAPRAQPEQSQSLPQAVVKGPPPPPKEKPAETKSAPKAGEEPEEKGVLDQLKEDAGRIGEILNPFKW